MSKEQPIEVRLQRLEVRVRELEDERARLRDALGTIDATVAKARMRLSNAFRDDEQSHRALQLALNALEILVLGYRGRR